MSVGNVNVELEMSKVGLGLRSVKKTIKYSDMTDSDYTGSFRLEDIPAYSMVIGTKVTVKVAFSGGDNTEGILTVGSSSDGHDWHAGTDIGDVFDVGTLMKLAATVLGVQTTAAEVHAQVTVDNDYTTITAGKIVVEVFYFSTVPELE